MSETDGKVRLFAALDVPRDVRDALGRWAVAARGVEGLRMLPPQSFHVTLCFLGWREADDAPRIGRLVADCAGPVGDLALHRVAWLPPRRPRVLAIDVADRTGALGELQARLAARLSAEAGYEPERRTYRPHLTVARLRGGPTVPPDIEAPPALEFAGEAVTLYRSHLRRAGARYEAVSRTEI